jgi:hypothetical protein
VAALQATGVKINKIQKHEMTPTNVLERMINLLFVVGGNKNLFRIGLRADYLKPSKIKKTKVVASLR